MYVYIYMSVDVYIYIYIYTYIYINIYIYRDKGKSEDDIKEWYNLSSEVAQAINSKQLVPTMRTQYMRVAFQIPFDATVRVSLDTNLCMINERTKGDS
jgi:SPX domain protein involved in polyphosphate accumulation